ncbi:hypothetical protein BG000_002642, partial [Podila horticola]
MDSSSQEPAPSTPEATFSSSSTSATATASGSRTAHESTSFQRNIAVYGFGLGALFGASVILATVVQTSIPQFWLFLAALGVFHSMEYIAIALFNPTKLKLD